MIQSNIILTQTFVDESRLSQIVADRFFNHHDLLPKSFQIGTESLEKNWEHYLGQNRILQADFKDKDDFKDSVMSLYQNYENPTLLFLGNLTQYSLPLQEGMLRILEEPPANLYIVLYAHAKNEILETISSRCTFSQIPRPNVINILDPDLMEKVKKKLPAVSEFTKILITKPQDVEIPDLSKVEREEIDLWLWQLSCYLDQYYIQQPNIKIAELNLRVLTAMGLNADNLQKKFALNWLKYS
jgi:hypothetical protein